MVYKYIISLLIISNAFQIEIFQNNVRNQKTGEIIKGDFNGDGKLETARIVKIKYGFGNPIEDGEPDEYEIQFSNSKIKSLKIGCCEAILVNEGDLNNDQKDEISIYQAPMNGCLYVMSAYTYTKLEWKIVVEPYIYPTGCESLTYTEIQNLIVKENNNIYYYTIEIEEWKLIKQKAKKQSYEREERRKRIKREKHQS